MTADPTELAAIPVLRDARSAPFYDAAACKRLLITRCEACGAALAPDARTCTRCAGTELRWSEASGAARLVSFTVVHHAPPTFALQVPFVLGIVELREGPWLYARIVHAGEGLAAGVSLRVAFVHPPEGESYPVFVTE